MVGDLLIKQGDIFWADLQAPRGSETGFRRPVVVIQQTAINASDINTILCVPLTTQTRLGESPGNVSLSTRQTGLPKVSVANVSQLVSLDKRFLDTYVATLPSHALEDILDGVDFLLGR